MGTNHDPILFKLRLKIHMRDCFACRYCGKRMNPLDDDITIDHVDPRGDNSETNLVTACQRCNQRKGQRHARDFMANRAREIEREIGGVVLGEASTPGWFPPTLQRVPLINNLESLLAVIAKESRIPVAGLVLKNNRKNFVAARRKFCVQASSAGYSLSEIAKAIGKHHTTVMHLIRTAVVVENGIAQTIDSLTVNQEKEDFQQLPQLSSSQQY